MKPKLQKSIAHFLLVACVLAACGFVCAIGDELPPSAASGQDADSSMSPAFVTSVQSLVETKQAVAFVLDGVKNYSRIAIPQNKNAQFVYVAVPNKVYRLSLETLELETQVNLPHSDDSPMLRTCYIGGTSKEDCTTNRIFALLISKENLLICGTVFGRPTCFLRKVYQPISSLGSFDVQLREADSRSQKAIALEDRNVFIGAYLRRGTDPAVYRSSLAPDSKPVRTSIEVQQSRALKPIYQPAKFISVHVVGDYAYYFFQENMEEMTTCGVKSQRIISRVARVCKSDPGFKQSWLSFAKSRLICAQGGNWVRTDGTDDENSAFYYDFLQDTYETDTHIYGLFIAAQSGIKASAICGFPFSTFNKVFGDQTVKLKRWDARDSDIPFAYFADSQERFNRSDCASLQMNYDQVSTYVNNNRYGFLKSARVIQDTNEPVAHDGENWLRLIVDKVPATQPGTFHNVAFVLTEAQSIKKILLASGTRCVLEEIQLDRSLDGQINDFKLAPTGDYLIVSTDSRVLRLPTSSCSRHTLRATCLAARDPYCGWNKRTFSCTNRPANTIEWEQDINPQLGQVCSDRSVSVDGGWSDWRPWQRCQPPRGSQGSSCTCRFRNCDNPKPRNGGRLCGKFHDMEVETQVVNCSVDGGWSSWEAWSACPSCDRTRSAVRERSRTCTQPQPRHGGAACAGGEKDGRETQTAACNAPDCNDVHVAVNGTWNQWTDWSPCSRPCGSGVSERTRYCNEPVHGGFPCVGDSREWTKCNTSPCLAARKAEQTGWMPTGKQRSASGRQVWMLVEASCRAFETETGEYKVDLVLANRTHMCDSPTDCTTQDSGSLTVNGNWGQWGAWSGCSKTCGAGYRERKRECDNPPASGTGAYCVGDAKQIESCTLQPCKLPEWADWSCWSDCQNPNGNAKGCGTGKQYRQRVCKNSNGGRTGCPAGTGVQERECSLDPCDYFTEWSAWSPCRSRLRSRTRKCLLSPTSALMAIHCRGNWDQTEECAMPPDPLESNGGSPTERPSLEKTTVKSIEIETTLAGVIGAVWLLSLILVSGATFCIVCCCFRRRISGYKSSIKSMQNKIDSLKSTAVQVQPPLQQMQRNDLDLPGYHSLNQQRPAAPGRLHSESRDTCSMNDPQQHGVCDDSLAASSVSDRLLPAGEPKRLLQAGGSRVPGGLQRSHSTSESTRPAAASYRYLRPPVEASVAGTGQRRPRFQEMPPDGEVPYGSYRTQQLQQQQQQQPRPPPNVYVTQRSQPQPVAYQHQQHMMLPDRIQLPPTPDYYPHQQQFFEDNSYESSSLMHHYQQQQQQQQHQYQEHHHGDRFQYPGSDQYFATMPASRSGHHEPRPRQPPRNLRRVSSGSQTDNSHQPPERMPDDASEFRGFRRQHSEQQQPQQRHNQPQRQPSTDFPRQVQQSYNDFQSYLQRHQTGT